MTDVIISQDLLKTMFDYREDGHLINKTLRPNAPIGAVAGCIQKRTGYRHMSVKGVLREAHQWIFIYHHGWLPTQIDHIDTNPLNCRIENLRPATSSQNGRNKKLNCNNKSGIKGVNWFRRDGKWEAKCKVDGKLHFLGRFADIKDAETVVRKFREEHHGEFCNHG